MNNIAVVGAGAWGTALAVILAKSGKTVTLVARDVARATAIRESRANFRLPGIELPEALCIAEAPPNADIYILAMPMQHLRTTLPRLPPGDAPVVLCCKGLEERTLLLAPEMVSGRPSAVLTGPNFAAEIAAGLPAAALLATPDTRSRAALMAALKTETLRLYGSVDILGAALGGATKNVIAIAAGAVIGAGLGENARAALITRGIAETARLIMALGGRAETASGLSGLGDLLLTCTGEKSRNFSLGLALGHGQPLAEILTGRAGVTEGVKTAPALLARAKAASVDMPIVAAVAKLLSNEMDFYETMAALMARTMKDE